MLEELGISLGTETVVVEKKLQLIGFRYESLNKPGEQTFYLEYYFNGVQKQISVQGYNLFDFYMNLWSNGLAIKELIEAKEGIDLSTVTLEQMEYQFVAGLPTEAPTEGNEI